MSTEIKTVAARVFFAVLGGAHDRRSQVADYDTALGSGKNVVILFTAAW